MTGRELDRDARDQVRGLGSDRSKKVARHLVAAGLFLDDDTERAYEHARYAVDQGGRAGVVHEMLGLAAYRLERYAEAAREFRTHRRLTASQVHVPMLADAERGLGRPEKALETLAEVSVDELPVDQRVEHAIVRSGALRDLGRLDEAVAALETSQLTTRNVLPYTVRLFAAYVAALEAAGRTEDAAHWREIEHRAEEALGVDESGQSVFDDAPEFVELIEDENEEEVVEAGEAEDEPAGTESPELVQDEPVPVEQALAEPVPAEPPVEDPAGPASSAAADTAAARRAAQADDAAEPAPVDENQLGLF